MRDDTDRGFQEFGGNELTVGSTIDDPAAIRVASPSGTNKISGNVLASDGKTQYEKTLIVLTQDELGGCYKFFAQMDGRTDDAGMVLLATLSRRGFELFVPLTQGQAPPVPAPPPGSDPTHGIPAGDFERIFQVYGFESDWQEPYAQGRVTWRDVIERQDVRDDFRHFPNTPPPAPVITAAERAQRVADVAAMQLEWPGMDLNNVDSYLQGRSSPKEFHDENMDRAGFHNAALHRVGRPY